MFAGLLSAGLAGIEQGLPLPEPVARDISGYAPGELAAMGVEALPTSLAEAIARFEGSTLMRESLGDHVFESLVANKRQEWDEYRSHVSEYELRRYLGVL